MKKSKSVALDNRDLNPLFSLMKGYGPLIALGVIAVLSVCAAFFIYRSSKAQSKGNGEKSVTDTEEEEEEKTNLMPKKRRVENKLMESTGNVCDSRMSSCSLSKDQDKVEESLCTDKSSPSGEGSPSHRHDPVVDYTTVQNGGYAPPTCFDDYTAQPGVEAWLLDDAVEQKQMEVGSDENMTDGLSGRENLQGFVSESPVHPFVDDAWGDLSGYFGEACPKMGPIDLHKGEVSCNSPTPNTSSMADSAYEEGEVEKNCRAQDLSISSANTDNDFTYYQQISRDGPTEQPERDVILEHKRKAEEDLKRTVGVTRKGPEDFYINHRVQEMPCIHLYKQDYLSFSSLAFTGMIGGSDMMKVVDVSPGVQAQSSGGHVQMEDRTEINIMEATMDNNEWLTGNESHCDFPWMSQSDGGESSSMAEESQQEIEWDTEKSEASEFSATDTSSDDDDLAMKRVATIPPMLQTVHVKFSVHYITDAPNQLLAVTGNQRELGSWQSFVPLQRSKNGFWANTVTLPVESQVEWKFVLVEDGKICRWEECSNRQLVLTGQEDDLYVLKWWGCL